MSKRPQIIVSVINDLATDQRVKKVCNVLNESFGDVLLVGRILKNSLPLERNYRTHRMKLIFTNGPLFYAEYNVRLFAFLLFHKADLLVSNDLDTLLANYTISRIKHKPLVYDSHEYFLGMPELMGRSSVQSIWRSIEKIIFPRLKTIITVNKSIASLYEKAYNKKLHVVRNVSPMLHQSRKATKKELGLPENKTIFILQGAGINMDRGAEEAIQAMQYVQDAVLLIIGSGDLFSLLPSIIHKYGLDKKVIVKNKMPYAELMQYTLNSDFGLSMDKDTNINYRFSLPNKLFDYIQAGLPILGSDLPELARIIRDYDIGVIFERHNPQEIGNIMTGMMTDKDAQHVWRRNLKRASEELCWEKESQVLKEIYSNIHF